MAEDKWKDIDTQVNSMIDWTKGLSATPTGNQQYTTQRQGHTHRKSEPDVVMIRQAQKSRFNASGQLPVPPQSAPVQPGTFTLDWNAMDSSHENGLDKEEDDIVPKDLVQFPELEAFGSTVGSKSPKNKTSPPQSNGAPSPMQSSVSNDHSHPGFVGIETPRPPPYQRSMNGPVRNIRPFNGVPESHIPQSPRMRENPYAAFITAKTPSANNIGYQSPKTNRRSSAPGNHIDPRAQSASPNIPRRSTSMQPTLPVRRRTQDNFIPIMFTPEMVNPGRSVPHQISPFNNKKPDDQEYTKALLQHQHDRMHRLERELQAKKELLESLSATVASQEKEACDGSNEGLSKCMPTPDDIRKLREINRTMEIECNCMIKEVDMVSSSGHNSMEGNFHDYIMKKVPSGESRRRPSQRPKPPLPSPPLPPPPDPPEEEKWSCTYCTFLNHSALDKCEMCEYRRDPAVTS